MRAYQSLGLLSGRIVLALRYTLTSFCLVFLAGCLMTRTNVQEVEQKKQMQDQVSTLQRVHADAQNQYNEVLENQRSISGRLEAIEASEKARQQQLAKEKQDADLRQQQEREDLQKKILALQEELTLLKDQFGTLSAQVAAGRPSVDRAAGDGAAGPLKSANDAFAVQDWRKAALLYQKFREKNPKSKLAPEATYKLAVCFVELGMKDEAIEIFQEVTSKYSKSEYNSKAKAALRKLSK